MERFNGTYNLTPVLARNGKRIVQSLSGEVVENADIFTGLINLRLIEGQDFVHAVNTSIYAMLLGDALGLGRLDLGDRATAEPIVCYQRDRPGELVHVDVKRIAGIPNGCGWGIHGCGGAPTVKRSSTGYR